MKVITASFLVAFIYAALSSASFYMNLSGSDFGILLNIVSALSIILIFTYFIFFIKKKYFKLSIVNAFMSWFSSSLFSFSISGFFITTVIIIGFPDKFILTDGLFSLKRLFSMLMVFLFSNFVQFAFLKIVITKENCSSVV